MITNNNEGGGSDQFSAAAHDTASALGGASSNASRQLGAALGAVTFLAAGLIYKWDFVFVGYWRRRIAHLYDRLGCKFLG